ncbi:MEDS domain-containing protein [Bacillus sp. T33-2]|uniref:MEDS domain-containing protein n=1 Tax=Bacillus sp. T33-2 TaxID=2054168 RepID=UPI0015E08BE5|nr:MEDS domain-containing protein [Bacillus sp. T33-2]
MINNMAQFTSRIKENGGGHILYFSDSEDQYVANAVEFIISGIKEGEHILFVENDRLYPRIADQLVTRLTTEEIKRIQAINNFDFYCSEGNFHPVTILNFFFNTIDPYYEKKLIIRAWGHVEWGSQQDIERTIASFEFELDRLMPEMDMVAVCAYNSDRVSDDLREKLMNCHGYLMTDSDILALSEKEAELTGEL